MRKSLKGKGSFAGQLNKTVAVMAVISIVSSGFLTDVRGLETDEDITAYVQEDIRDDVPDDNNDIMTESTVADEGEFYEEITASESEDDSYEFDLDDFYVSEAFLMYGSARTDDENGGVRYDESLEMIEASDDCDFGESIENIEGTDRNEDEIQSYVTRKTSQEGIDLIKKWEGFREKAYKALSTETYYTIGYGHYGPDVTANMVITREQAEELLKQDVQKFENKLNTFCSTYDVFLSQNQFDALISFSYNVGTGWLSSSTIRTYILDGFDKHSDKDYKDALYMWRYSGGKEIQGLANRRIDEGNLFVKYRLTSENNGLKITMECPRIIGCKSAATFTLKCEGGSGSYKYRIYDLFIKDGSENVTVYDAAGVNNGAFSAGNTFQFTFYASGNYYIRFEAMDSSTKKTAVTGVYEMPINVRDDRCPAVETVAANIATTCKNTCSSEYDKALWLHDYLIQHSAYDASCGFGSAEAVLARGKGNGEAYHRAYAMLLNKVGISNAKVTGNGHVWTAVKIDGKWYQVDTAWDDKTSTVSGFDASHMYFGLTDEIMKTVHSDHTAISGKVCNSLDSNYYIKSGKITTFSDPYRNAIDRGFDDGNIVVNVPYISNASKGNYDNVLMPLIVYELNRADYGGRKVKVEYTDGVMTATESITDPVVKKAYLTLNGRTGLVFELALPDSLKSSSTAYAELTCDGVKKKIFIKDADCNGGLYDFPYELAAKQLSDKVTLRIYKTSSTSVKLANYNTASTYEYSYSVSDYVSAVNNSSSNVKLKTMLNSMMDYSTCARNYLDDEGLEWPSGIDTVAYSKFAAYEYDMTGAAAGIRYLGSSLILEDSTTIRHYFELESGADIASYSFKLAGTELEKHAQGSRCYVEVKDILPMNFGTAYRVTVSGSGSSMTIGYSVFSYGEKALFKRGSSEGLCNVMRAMYLYGQAAKNYFGN